MNIGDVYMHAIFNQTHFTLYLPDYQWTESNGVMIKGFYDFEPITTNTTTLSTTSASTEIEPIRTNTTTLSTSESTEIEPITTYHPTTEQITQSTLKSTEIDEPITTLHQTTISHEKSSTRQRPSTIIPYNSSSRISNHSFFFIITFILTLYSQ